MHTHFHVGLQVGAVIWAAAKPKKNTIAVDAVRSDIWCLTACE
jgi:hypothetical protein